MKPNYPISTWVLDHPWLVWYLCVASIIGGVVLWEKLQ